MSQQIVLITGAITGIGKATATAFAKDGASLVISGRDRSKGDAFAASLRALGAQTIFIPADVRNEKEVTNLIDSAVSTFGRIDVAVNAAGTEGKPGPIVEQTQETYAATFDTNVLGTLLCLKHELRIMLAQKSGSIVNISSTFGRTGGFGASIYAASKHAVEGLSKSAALEAASSNVRVNVVAPGGTDTGMLDRFTGNEEGKKRLISQVPMARLATPEEMADAIVFLGSSKASFITGTSLAVDGGKLAK